VRRHRAQRLEIIGQHTPRSTTVTTNDAAASSPPICEARAADAPFDAAMVAVATELERVADPD